MSTQPADPIVFAQNMAQVQEKTQRILQCFLSRQLQDAGDVSVDPLGISGALVDLMAHYMTDPTLLWKQQLGWWEESMALIGNATRSGAPIRPSEKDRRFRDAGWDNSLMFDFLKQSYLLNARWMEKAVRDASKALTPHEAHKLSFYTRQMIDALSPSNFLMTNPEVLKATLDSNAENLVKGLQHLLEDIERGEGKLRISMTDPNAFGVGKNLAITPGKVVFENDLMQLIQYEATTQNVHKTPLLLIPAWINKYYIFDLQQDNSFVKWLVDQGHTVFVISWVNPNAQHSHKEFADYMLEGPLAALDVIEQQTGEARISCIGYCLGGTLLAITQAWLAAKGQADRIASATTLTTLVDFAEAGDLSVFVDEAQIKALEARMSVAGYLDGNEMSTTFNMLRANDLIWSFVVNNYLLGKDRFPFDLLYWNSDSTRMPARMHSFYLRSMYQQNLLAKGMLRLADETIELTRIHTPSYVLATREDHIAPWKSTYKATQLYAGDTRFVLAASGHVAGVINPPARQKYSFWSSDRLPKSADQWLESAQETAGSWWTDWNRWQESFAGETIPARTIKHALEDAPGRYVKAMS